MLITCLDGHGRPVAVHELYEALQARPEVRGRVSFAESRETPDGALGGVTDVLLTHGLDAVVGIVVGLVVGWLQRRTGPRLVVKMEIPPWPAVELSSTDVRDLTDEQARDLAAKIRAELEPGPAMTALEPGQVAGDDRA